MPWEIFSTLKFPLEFYNIKRFYDFLREDELLYDGENLENHGCLGKSNFMNSDWANELPRYAGHSLHGPKIPSIKTAC